MDRYRVVKLKSGWDALYEEYIDRIRLERESKESMWIREMGRSREDIHRDFSLFTKLDEKKDAEFFDLLRRNGDVS